MFGAIFIAHLPYQLVFKIGEGGWENTPWPSMPTATMRTFERCSPHSCSEFDIRPRKALAALATIESYKSAQHGLLYLSFIVLTAK